MAFHATGFEILLLLLILLLLAMVVIELELSLIKFVHLVAVGTD